jgi:ribosomal protein S18 acetylase RimI-like enzyme
VAVLPEFRGAGIGEALMSHPLSRIAQKAKTVYLEVRPANIIAIELYSKLSFAETAKRSTSLVALTLAPRILRLVDDEQKFLLSRNI